MKNIFNKTNAPYLVAGALATLALISSGVVGVLTAVAVFNASLPLIAGLVGLAVFSAATVALSSVAISKNKTISSSEKLSEGVDYLDLAVPSSEQKQRANSLDYLNIDNVPKQPDHLSIDAAKEHLMSLSRNQDIFYDAESGDEKDTEISSLENEPAKKENGQSWSAWSLDKAKTAAKLVVGGAMVAAAAAPILVSTLFTGSSASPAGDMFNSINGTCSRW